MSSKQAKKHKVSKHSDSDSSSSEHELFYYRNDRIKLMQEVLRLVKAKKLMSMAPDSLKDLQTSAVKSLLLEELLGISNKRLRSILAGENLDYDSSSSSDSAIDKNPDEEVISLDDITDGSEICISDEDVCMEMALSERERIELEVDNSIAASNKRKKRKHSDEKVKVKKENDRKKKKHKKRIVKEEPVESNPDEPIFNILNLLELQARARAIRSRLASELLNDNESSSTILEQSNDLIDTGNIKKSPKSDDGSSDSVVFISPEKAPVVTVQSNSESETEKETGISKTQPTVNSIEDDYDNDVLTVTEDDITLDKDSTVNATNENKKLDDKEEEGGSNTWKTRWLDSKKVKDVMKTTKLYNNIRQSRKQKIVTQETNREQEEAMVKETVTDLQVETVSDKNEAIETIPTANNEAPDKL